MTAAEPAGSPGSCIERLHIATNAHDLDTLVACFAPDYRNETPAHPSRGFKGREQVRRNWERIFAAVPDLTADMTWVQGEGAIWSEWEMRGTRRDGQPHLMRGVIIFGVADGLASWARFYLEPVELDGPDVDGAVTDALARMSATEPRS